MKSARILISAVAAAAIAGLAVSPAVADQNSGAAGAVVSPAATGASAIAAAADPSTAIAAYASAAARDSGNLDIERAYVRRMVDFGLPEMAEAQAKDLVTREPQDGLAWAVAGYMSAKRGETAQALEDLARAAEVLPGDAFVQRTAGQVLAWYDLRPDEGKPGTPEHSAAEALRGQLIGKTVYTAAYNAAVKADQAAAAAAPETPPATQSASGVATSEAVGAGAGTTPDFQPPGGTVYTPAAAATGVPVYAVPTGGTYSPYATYDPYTPTYYTPYGNVYGVYTNPYAVVGQPCAACYPCPCPCVTGPVWWPASHGGNGLGYQSPLFHHEPNRNDRGAAGAWTHDGFGGPVHVWTGQAPAGATYRPTATGVRGGPAARAPVFAVPTAVRPAGVGGSPRGR